MYLYQCSTCGAATTEYLKHETVAGLAAVEWDDGLAPRHGFVAEQVRFADFIPHAFDNSTEVAPANYMDYLKSPEWQEKRHVTLARWGCRCCVCNSPNSPEVHHRTYARLGRELPNDVVVLCHVCHEFFSNNRKLYKDYNYDSNAA
jgi:hypothetical protein